MHSTATSRYYRCRVGRSFFCQTRVRTLCPYMYLATESPWNNTCRPDMCLWQYARHKHSLGGVQPRCPCTGISPAQRNSPWPPCSDADAESGLGHQKLRGQYIVVCSSGGGGTMHVVLLVCSVCRRLTHSPRGPPFRLASPTALAQNILFQSAASRQQQPSAISPAMLYSACSADAMPKGPSFISTVVPNTACLLL